MDKLTGHLAEITTPEYRKEFNAATFEQNLQVRKFRRGVLLANSFEFEEVDMFDINRMSIKKVVNGMTFNMLIAKLNHSDRSWCNDIWQ